MVSPLHRDGTARRGVALCGEKVLREARRRKERTYPELSGAGGRARLVVFAATVGGRWSQETAQFLRGLAHFKSEGAPELLQIGLVASVAEPSRVQRRKGFGTIAPVAEPSRVQRRKGSGTVALGTQVDSWR